jgi:hypothetical protein
MIDVDFAPDRCGGLYPATMGKTGHVKIHRKFIAKIQVSFELHKETGEIMLVDRSPSQNCYVYYVQSDDECRDFYNFGALVLIPAANQIVITFGVSIKYQFYVDWRMRGPIDLEAWKSLAARTGQSRHSEVSHRQNAWRKVLKDHSTSSGFCCKRKLLAIPVRALLFTNVSIYGPGIVLRSSMLWISYARAIEKRERRVKR